MGMNKGMVIFIRVDNLDYVYSRFSIHRQAITHIHELREQRKFISICIDLDLVVWGFEGNREKIF